MWLDKKGKNCGQIYVCLGHDFTMNLWIKKMAHMFTLMRQSVALKNHIADITGEIRFRGQDQHLLGLYCPGSHLAIYVWILKSFGTNDIFYDTECYTQDSHTEVKSQNC